MTGVELTLIETNALPLKQLPSLTIALSTIDAVTFTVRDDDDEVMPFCVTPSDQMTFHGPIPVSVNGMLTDDAPQEALIVAGSVMVGRGAMATSVLLLALQPADVATVTARCTLPAEPDV
jgi:hypothetical protein